MVFLYFIVAIVIFFICTKKLYPIAVEKSTTSRYSEPSDFLEYWLIGIIPLFWVIAVPLLLFWLLLENIYKKISNN